jgi:hypothetical protein
MNLDDLELELRKLPGICWVAFRELGDRLVVQVHATHDAHNDVALEASRIAARHCELPIAVDVVRWMTPPGPGTERARRENMAPHANGSSADAAGTAPKPPFELLRVLTVADTAEIEVHLGDGATRTIGRAALARGLLGAVEATVEAIRGFPVELAIEPEWARTIEMTSAGRPIVAVALAPPGGDESYGLSRADSEMEAAVRATLEALDHHLQPVRRPWAS